MSKRKSFYGLMLQAEKEIKPEQPIKQRKLKKIKSVQIFKS